MLNWRFVLRGGVFALLIIAGLFAIAGLALRMHVIGPPDGPLPPLSTLTIPRGELPAEHVGLSEWAKYEGEGERLVGSGFFFILRDGTVIGATAAHSLALRSANTHLNQVAFTAPGNGQIRYELSALYGIPGKPRWGPNMNGDYVLLQTKGGIDPNLVLTPDPRGEPEPGERVVLYSGLGELTYWGTVHTADAKGVWLLMDNPFEPGRMSGSPILSAHTGNLVGMALAAAYRELGLFIGITSIENLVGHAERAELFPSLAEFTR
jgi:hypothetical protein